MELIFKDGERERAREVFNGMNALFPTDSVGKEYGVTIQITDPAIAQMFIAELMWRQDTKIDPGFKVMAVHYNSFLDKSETRQQLIEAIDKVLGTS